MVTPAACTTILKKAELVANQEYKFFRHLYHGYIEQNEVTSTARSFFSPMEAANTYKKYKTIQKNITQDEFIKMAYIFFMEKIEQNNCSI